ncbi:MAG: hypothetical protein FJ404_01865 [Verrucomicrobia bacterium]|nr:hypothetical protein [Verrucomicrobiota bacterium]
MTHRAKSFYDPDRYIPSFLEFSKGLGTASEPSTNFLIPVMQSEDASVEPSGFARSQIPFVHGEDVKLWNAPPLRELCRGEAKPPELRDYPSAYLMEFSIFDQHLTQYTRVVKPPRDAELEEIFVALRKRPDGKSLGSLHDYLWRVSALILATRPLSLAEFEAIVGRLEKSARTFGMGSTSRNMASSIAGLY